jgi:endogenous inhibitor of DNA gyrase (YacG/DUF329 family)
VATGEELEEITTQSQCDDADSALALIRAYTKSVDENHQSSKAPFLSACRSLDLAKNLAMEKVIPLKAALETKQRSFKAVQLQRQREAEERQRQEVERIRKEQEAVFEEARLAKIRADAEAERIAEHEARLKREREEAGERRRQEEIARQAREAEIARMEAYANSPEGQAEAQRQREEAEAQRLAREEERRIEVERLERDRIELERQRAESEAAEKSRKEEAALQAAVTQRRVEEAAKPVTPKAEQVKTEWSFMLTGKGDAEIKMNMILCAARYPELFDIEPKTAVVAKLAKQIKGGAHDYSAFRFFEKVK